MKFLITMLFASLAHADSGQITLRTQQTFRGWGMSLAWEANLLYGNPYQTPITTDPTFPARFMDLLVGDSSQRQTLGLNVVRYNIGGGDAPTHHHMNKTHPGAQMEGFQDSMGGPFIWTRDSGQIEMLKDAVDRGANIVEGFNNSPPYWMTISGCASGNAGFGADNLSPLMYDAYANYLTQVALHFRDDLGITFNSIEPFNEPDSFLWLSFGGQEGNSASAVTQSSVITLLKKDLQAAGLNAIVSSPDDNSMDSVTGTIGAYDASAVASLGQLNVHSYNGSNRAGVMSLAASLGIPVWMSEAGCCYHGQGDGTPIWGAIWMADQIRKDIRDMGAQVWTLWQPDWNIVTWDKTGAITLEPQFYALSHYTNFIRPEDDFKIISAGSADNTLAAYSAVTQRLVLVSTNSTAGPNDFDVSQFAGLPATATLYRTTASGNFQSSQLPLSSGGHLADSAPANSITTYVIDGVDPLTSVSVKKKKN